MSTFRHEPHSWKRVRGLPWEICGRCGLVHLRNRLTEFCVRHGCNAREHSGYAAERERGGRW